jgi:ABC-type multidrug transport system ATPase subunit
MSVADYAYIMSKGTIVYESTPDQLIENERIKSTYLGVGESEEGGDARVSQGEIGKAEYEGG